MQRILRADFFVFAATTAVLLVACSSADIDGSVAGAQQVGGRVQHGSCQSQFKCAPCTNPLNGLPTGAPGCPGT